MFETVRIGQITSLEEARTAIYDLERAVTPAIEALGHWYGNIFPVDRYGARGDGASVAEDTDGILRARDAAQAAGGILWFRPFGAYRINQQLLLDAPIAVLGNRASVTQTALATAGLRITSSNVTVKGLDLIGPGHAESVFSDAMRIVGASAAAPITNVTIDDCRTDEWGFYSIYAEWVKDYSFLHNKLADCNYGHIMMVACENGLVLLNDFRRTYSAVAGTGYGISATRDSSLSLALSPRSKNILVGGNYGEDTQMSLYDTHAGDMIQFVVNRGRGGQYGVQVGPSLDTLGASMYAPHRCKVLGNDLDSGVTNGSKDMGVSLSGAVVSVGVVNDYALDCTIEDNVLRNYGRDEAAGLGACIGVQGTRSAKVAGNDMYRPAMGGVVLYTDNYDPAITDNTTTDVWANAAALAVAYHIRSNNNFGVFLDGNVMSRGDLAGKTYINGYGYRNTGTNNLIRMGHNAWWDATIQIAADGAKNSIAPEWFTLSNDRGDANVTVIPGYDQPYQLFATALTANRTFTVDLAPSGAHTAFYVMRTGGGAFSLTIADSVVGALTVLRQNEWAKLGYDNGQMKVVARGVLDAESPQGQFNVKHFGALGNGSTDDTAAINAAIAAAYAAGGGEVYFPPGRYRVTSTITITGAVTLRGAGHPAGGASNSAATKASTLIHDFVGDFLVYNAASGNVEGSGGGADNFRLVQVNGSAATTAGVGVAVLVTNGGGGGTTRPTWTYFRRLLIEEAGAAPWSQAIEVRCTTAAPTLDLYFDSISSHTTGSTGGAGALLINGCWSSWWNNINCYDTGGFVRIGTVDRCYDAHFVNCSAQSFELDQATNCAWRGGILGSTISDTVNTQGNCLINPSRCSATINGTGTPNSASTVFQRLTGNGILDTTGRVRFQGPVVLGTAALATTATDGFVYIPTCAGPPTAAPTAYTGTVAMIYDTTNNRLYIYNPVGGWKSALFA